jgi:Tfp pilus assembly protein PilZ
MRTDPSRMGNEANRRHLERFKGRISCSFKDGDTVQRGFATNVSAGGLFLQSRAEMEPGTKLVLTLDREDGQPLVLTGKVARMRRSHRAAASVTQPGFGFALDSAPEDYFQFIMQLLENN